MAAQLGSCATSSSALGRLCALEAALGATDPSAVGALATRVGDLSSALTATVAVLSGQSLTGDLPPALTSSITSALAQLAGLQGTVAGLTGTTTTLAAGLDDVRTALGGVDVPALAATVDNVTAALGAGPDGLGATAIDGQHADLTTTQAQLAAAQAQLGAVDVTALATAQAGTAAQVATIQSTLSSVCAAVDGQALPVLGTLPLAGDVAGLLTAQLTDACP
ncbi:MAG: hypothetical protein HZB46_13865 [Solirubrobacterales bacterium]|nr:hypothetical protein [Solirubrobacterales bacterium]